jgi:hypothetical protein
MRWMGPTRVQYTTATAACADAQRAGHSPRLVWFRRDILCWVSAAPAVRRSSPLAERGFCGVCGTALFLRYNDGNEIGMMLGSLNNPSAFRPSYLYGIEGRLDWVDCGTGLPGCQRRSPLVPLRSEL